MTNHLRLAMIYGSVREGRFCETVVAWAASRIAHYSDFELDLIDPASDWPNLRPDEIRRQIAAADAFVVVTPEYNHSSPAALKALIDAAHSEWHAKPVAFVSYGGISGGLRAVEHLRNVFVELHAVPIRDSVSFPNAWEAFVDGNPIEEPRCRKAMDTMLSRLAWWARALKTAREQHAYGEAA